MSNVYEMIDNIYAEEGLKEKIKKLDKKVEKATNGKFTLIGSKKDHKDLAKKGGYGLVGKAIVKKKKKKTIKKK